MYQKHKLKTGTRLAFIQDRVIPRWTCLLPLPSVPALLSIEILTVDVLYVLRYKIQSM